MNPNVVSSRLSRISPALTLALSAKASRMKAAGRDIVNMGVGEPDFDTPASIREAAHAAMNSGQTRYTPTAGTSQLRTAISEKLMRENGLSYSLDEIVVSNGAKQAIHNAVTALVNPGDEVIVPCPYWVSYVDVVRLVDGTPVLVDCTLGEGWKLTPEKLERSIGGRTKLLFLNSPGNPSGAVYRRDELEALGKVLARHPEIHVISDDIYEHILVGQLPMVNIANACPDIAERVIVVNGVSKAFAMTGWRIGYTASSAKLAAAMETVQSQTSGSTNSIAQAAAAAALPRTAEIVGAMASIYRERHASLCSRLSSMPGVRFLPSDGAFYVFVDVANAIDGLRRKGRLQSNSDVELSSYLLDHAGLAVVPGSAFGSPGHLRLSFATSAENIEKACDRLGNELA